MILSDSNQMLALNFKHLFTKIEKGIKQVKVNDPSDIIIIVDNLNILLNSNYSANELNFIEILN